MKNKPYTSLTAAVLFSAAALAGLFNLQPAFAGTRTWNGGATPDGNWTTPGNWNGVTPTNNDLLVFNGGTQTATTNNFAAGVPFNNISFSSGAAAFTLNGNPITISSPTDAGSGLIAGGSINSVSPNTETIRNPIVFASGNHTIANSGAGVLRLNGTITHSNGAALVMSGNINAAGGLSTNGALNGILGGWAVYGTNWATLDASSNVIGFTGYTSIGNTTALPNNSASNVRFISSGSGNQATPALPASTTSVNSLLLSSAPGTQTVTVGTGTNLVLGVNGGIYNATAVGTLRAFNIGANAATGGTLTAGDGTGPAQITLSSANLPSASTFLAINSAIKDNGLNGSVTVTLAGAYCNLNGTNTYSGGTYILQGRISQPNENTFGSGPVFIVSGGQANPGRSAGTGVNITNDFYLEGSGTVENSGMGALRMFGSGGVTIGGVATGTKLTGRITLTANATVCANGDVTGGVGICGKITGPGGFALGSTTFDGGNGAGNNNGAGGVFTVGDLNGAAIPNDYAGDTSINGSAGSAAKTGNTVGATLKIFTAADNNIMPHGSTGSFVGGKTGNLILNATATAATTHAATFDLNGSTQTINGLGSTVASPANNFITTSGGPGTLILGDNNATATFGGILQDGGGALSVVKIGTGTENFTGANSYTGGTIVKAGILAMTTATTSTGNYSVSNNAALVVSTTSAGATLQAGNLTLDTSSALQFNVGTNGNPASPIVQVTGALTLNGPVTVSISGSSLTPGTFTVMTYPPANRSGSGNFVMVNSPRVVASLNDDPINGIVSVTVTSADSGIKWEGGAAGGWDINNVVNNIWQTVPSGNSAYYIESGSGNDAVLFDDTLTGTPNVNLTTVLSPQSITVNNAAATYVFGGSGKITGTTGLTKNGSGTVILANGGNNDFLGDIALNAGTLVASNDWSVGNTISGAGTLLKIGSGSTLILSGINPNFTGQVGVSAGTLKVLNGAALSTASSTTISNGAILDIGVNSVDMGTNAITVSGSGTGGGAIINSSGNAGFLVSNFRSLTLAGNTTIGGPGRLDLRADDANDGTNASLSTSGNSYSLTKVSGSQFQLAGIQMDPALGDIDVQGGIFGIQGQISSLGNPNNALTVESGATFQIFAVANVMNKVLVLKDGGTFNNANSTNTFGGTVTMQGAGLFNIGGTSLTLTNVVGGTGPLTKLTGGSPLILSGNNTYTGGTVANAGLVSFSADNNLGALPGSPTPANVILNGGGISASTDVTVSPNRGIAVGPTSGNGVGFIDVLSTMTYNGVIANNSAGVGGFIKTNSGTLFLGGTNTYTGGTFVGQGILALTGNGSISSSATINLGNGTLDTTARVDGALTLAPGQTLAGSGQITGNVTNGPGSTVSPGGNTDGFISVSGTSGLLVFQGTNIMNLDKDNSSYDTISATSISYGGTLVLVISNTFSPLADGDAFPLYSANNYSGAFANIIPASPGSGLAWNTNTLATDGVLRVTTGPTLPTTNASISSVTLSGTNLLVQGTNNNVPNTSFQFVVLTSTNLSLPLSNWTAGATNPFNPDGTFDYTNPIVPGTPRQFIDVLVVP